MFNWQIHGNEEIQKYLQKSVTKNKFAHAYIFCGPYSLGKTKTAQYFAKSILCSSIKKIPCGQCNNCAQIKKHLHPDFYCLDNQESKSIGIKLLKSYIKKLNTSNISGNKILLIPNAHHLTLSASNALLKTLEEPSKNSIIILTTNKEYILPQTIISRCNIIRFKPLSRDKIINALQKNTQNILNDTENIASISQGKIGQAILLSKTDYFNEYEKSINFFLTLQNSHIIDKIKLLQENFFSKKITTEQRNILLKELKIWQSLYRDILLLKINLHGSIAHPKHKIKLTQIAETKEIIDIIHILKEFKKTITCFSLTNTNARLLIENLVIEF